MNIKVRDLSNVEIDGQNAGCIVDVLKNHASVVGMQEALLAAAHDWHGEVVRQHQDVHASAVDKLKADQEKALSDLKAQHEKTVAEHKSLVAALGGTELAQQLRREQELKAAYEAKAHAEATIAKHTGA